MAGAVYDILIWGGAAVTLAGLALLVRCILRVSRAKKDHRDEAALRAALEAVVPWNLAALFLSAIGLMMVVIGIILG